MSVDVNKKGMGFWQRQFSPNATSPQLYFDIGLGIILPLLCIIIDPFVFRYNSLATSPLSKYRIFAYLAIALGIITLSCWLAFNARVGAKWHGFFAGILLFGAVFAFAGGLVLLPFSLLGLLLAGIGLFGFTPFLTGFVYLRNGFRALKHKEQLQTVRDARFFIGLMILGLALIVTLPVAAQWQTSQITNQGLQLILHGTSNSAEQGVQILRSAFWCDETCYIEIVEKYIQENDETRRKVLAKAFQQLTGIDIKIYIRDKFID